MTKLFRLALSVLLLAACEKSRPEDQFPEWGEPCRYDGLCGPGLACNTGDGIMVGGHCADACKTADDCDAGQFCNKEGACTVPCKEDSDCLFASNSDVLLCFDNVCV